MKEWIKLNKKLQTRDTDKPYLKAVQENHNWIYCPPVSHGDWCFGRYETISNEIAERLAKSAVFGEGISPFQLEPLLKKLKDNPESAPDLYAELKESCDKYKNDIYQACIRYGCYSFNYLYDDEGEIVDYEEITYKPHLDTSMMHYWDE